MAKTRWKKGQSGNPAGRKPENPEIRAALKLELTACLKVLAKIRDDAGAETKDRVAACKVIFDFGLAKPAPELGAEMTSRLDALVKVLS